MVGIYFNIRWMRILGYRRNIYDSKKNQRI